MVVFVAVVATFLSTASASHLVDVARMISPGDQGLFCLFPE
jgi:hypothetical protein